MYSELSLQNYKKIAIKKVVIFLSITLEIVQLLFNS